MIDIVPSRNKKEYNIVKTNSYQVYNFLNTNPDSVEGLDYWGVSIYDIISADFDFKSYFSSYMKSEGLKLSIGVETLVSIVNNSFLNNGIYAIMKATKEVDGSGKLSVQFVLTDPDSGQISFKGDLDAI